MRVGLAYITEGERRGITEHRDGGFVEQPQIDTHHRFQPELARMGEQQFSASGFLRQYATKIMRALPDWEVVRRPPHGFQIAPSHGPYFRALRCALSDAMNADLVP
jgi:hypothetical protein